MIIPSARRALVAAVAACACVGGVVAAIHYHRLSLSLSHYDARGHLVVARRVVDSITPGWQQIGAVWLPLPHLLNAVPVQIDAFYRTGASAIAISVLSFAIAAAAIAWIATVLTNSPWAGAAGAAVFALNPNVLYLQATPMTEPLLLGLSTVAVALLMAWLQQHTSIRASGRERVNSRTVGILFALACMTRYEAWPVTAAALSAAGWVRWRAGLPIRDALAPISKIAVYPALMAVGFVVFSRIVVGQWFVAGGFFVPENIAYGRPSIALAQVLWGTRLVSSGPLMGVAVVGAIVLTTLALLDRRRSMLLVPLALAATAVLPWSAFVDGHPFRIRYMVPLIAAEAVIAGTFVALWRSLRVLGPAALLLLTLFQLRPVDASAPMMMEAQWDRPNVPERRRVTDCLRAGYGGETVMASMGSLGHYLQEMSQSGFQLRDFLHEGNGDIWLNALEHPRPYVGWMLIEEKAEGGDMLAERARENPQFLQGFSRLCEGAGVALYRRDVPDPMDRAPDLRSRADGVAQ